MRTLRLIFGIFFVVGLGLLTGGVYSFQHTRRFLQTAVEAPGVVIENIWREDLSGSRRSSYWTAYPRVRFRTGDGREISFISNNGSSRPSYRVNEPIAVLYDPQQPQRAYIKSFASLWMLSIILCGMGAIFSSFGIVAVVCKGVGARKHAWLEQNGRRIQAEIARVELNTSVRVNGASPYRIVCQWRDPARNEVHVFNSANIWFNPSEYISAKTIEVLVDPNNLRRYAVETAFLPKLV